MKNAAVGERPRSVEVIGQLEASKQKMEAELGAIHRESWDLSSNFGTGPSFHDWHNAAH
jgi:hypothetical protein